jgi:cytochrome c-type biogenesis protein CcmH/NrfG
MVAQEISATRKAGMTDRPSSAGGARVGRWILIFALVLIGVALYFAYAARTPAVAPPAAEEAQ